MSGMVIGCCKIELYLPGVRSLKGKRRILKSTIARLQREFNVSCAEIDLHDVWQSSTLGVVMVTTEATHANRVLEKVAYWLERNRPDIDIIDHHVEIIHY